MKKILYFTTIVSLLGTQILSVQFGPYKMSLFRVSLIALLLLLIPLLFNKSGQLIIWSAKRNKYSIGFMLFWLINAILSFLWVRDFDSWLKSIYFLGIGVFCTICFASLIKDKKSFTSLFYFLQLMIIPHIFIGWYEVATGNYYFVEDRILNIHIESQLYRPISIFGNQNDYALAVLFGAVVSIACAKMARKQLFKIFGYLIATNCIVLLILTNSRANIIALVIICVVFFALSDKKKWSYVVKISLCILIFVIINPSKFGEFISSVTESFNINISESANNSDSIRYNLILNGLYFLFETFGFGTGAGNIESWMANSAIYPTNGITNIHNWWMEILTGYGLVVFIGYLAFYFKLAKDILRIYRHTNDLHIRAMSLSIFCFMAGFVIASISSSSNISTEWLWVFWSIAIAFQGNIYSYK